MALDGEEDLTRVERAAIDGHACHPHTQIAPDEGALRRSHQLFNGEYRHAPRYG
jgi:hypothetical protein